MDDLRHLWPLGEIIGDRQRVRAMLRAMRRASVSIPCRNRNALNGRQRRAEIAQQRDARLEDIGDRPERLDRLRPDRAVVAGIGRVQRGLALGECASQSKLPPSMMSAADRVCRGRRDISWSNRRPPPRHDRTGAPAAARRCCP